uniref:Uncharacterized protein n=1 Tax=Solanum lycopersicum TaxID=4081 RepID=A0A3Q7G9J4_SOLLC
TIQQLSAFASGVKVVARARRLSRCSEEG